MDGVNTKTSLLLSYGLLFTHKHNTNANWSQLRGAFMQLSFNIKLDYTTYAVYMMYYGTLIS